METPIVLAFLLCDHVWQNPDDGTHSILNTFSGLGGLRFPLTRRSVTLFFVLTNGRGSQKLRIELVDVDETRKPIFVAEADLHFVDPRQVVEQAIAFKNVTFPQPGDYRLKLFVGREFLMERRLEVAQAGELGY